MATVPRKQRGAAAPTGRTAALALLSALALAFLGGCAIDDTDAARAWMERHYPGARHQFRPGMTGPERFLASVEARNAEEGYAAALNILANATRLPTVVCVSWPQDGGYSRLNVTEATSAGEWERARAALPAGASERIIATTGDGFDACQLPLGVASYRDGKREYGRVYTAYVTTSPELVAGDPQTEAEGWVTEPFRHLADALPDVARVADFPLIRELGATDYRGRFLLFDSPAKGWAALDRLGEGWEVHAGQVGLGAELATGQEAAELSQLLGDSVLVARQGDGTTLTVQDGTDVAAIFQRVRALKLPSPVVLSFGRPNDGVDLDEPTAEEAADPLLAPILAAWKESAGS